MSIAEKLCKDCKYRHTYCHASCEVYNDIVHQKAKQREQRRQEVALDEAVFLMDKAQR